MLLIRLVNVIGRNVKTRKSSLVSCSVSLKIIGYLIVYSIIVFGRIIYFEIFKMFKFLLHFQRYNSNNNLVDRYTEKNHKVDLRTLISDIIDDIEPRVTCVSVLTDKSYNGLVDMSHSVFVKTSSYKVFIPTVFSKVN